MALTSAESTCPCYTWTMTSADEVRDVLAADRERTLERLSGLERELAGIVESAQAANADDEHDPEGATIAFEREHAAALAGQAREHLAEIDAALRRIDEGSYGTCVGCGRPIGAERLAARPVTQTCIACATGRRR
jgi:DnaK suppressor protein